MRGAKRHVSVTDDGDQQVEYEAAEVPSVPFGRPSAARTPAEFRRLRTMVWVLLAKQGLNPTEIARACKDAGRSRAQITKTLRRVSEQGRTRASLVG